MNGFGYGDFRSLWVGNTRPTAKPTQKIMRDDSAVRRVKTGLAAFSTHRTTLLVLCFHQIVENVGGDEFLSCFQSPDEDSCKSLFVKMGGVGNGRGLAVDF